MADNKCKPGMRYDSKSKKCVFTKSKMRELIDKDYANLKKKSSKSDFNWAGTGQGGGRRKLKSGEIEIMKGRGSRQVWFYVKNKADAERLVRLGRNSAFPTGITKNNSKQKFNKGFFIND